MCGKLVDDVVPATVDVALLLGSQPHPMPRRLLPLASSRRILLCSLTRRAYCCGSQENPNAPLSSLLHLLLVFAGCSTGVCWGCRCCLRPHRDLQVEVWRMRHPGLEHGAILHTTAATRQQRLDCVAQPPCSSSSATNREVAASAPSTGQTDQSARCSCSC